MCRKKLRVDSIQKTFGCDAFYTCKTAFFCKIAPHFKKHWAAMHFTIVKLPFSARSPPAQILCVDKIGFRPATRYRTWVRDQITRSSYAIEVRDRGTKTGTIPNFGPAGIRRGFPPPPHRRTRSHPPTLAHLHMSSRLTLIHRDCHLLGDCHRLGKLFVSVSEKAIWTCEISRRSVLEIPKNLF